MSTPFARQKQEVRSTSQNFFGNGMPCKLIVQRLLQDAKNFSEVSHCFQSALNNFSFVIVPDSMSVSPLRRGVFSSGVATCKSIYIFVYIPHTDLSHTKNN